MNIIQIPTFTDNYVWIMHELNNDFAVVVDPGESKPIIDALNINNLQLSDILLTHHHHDHIGGVKKLRKFIQQQIYMVQKILGFQQLLMLKIIKVFGWIALMRSSE